MEQNLSKLRRLRDKMPHYRDVLDLAEKLLREKSRLKSQAVFPSLPLDSQKAKIQIQEGFPYLRPGEIPLDLAQTYAYFSSLLGILQEHHPGRHEALSKTIQSSGFAFDRSLKRLLENQLTENLLGVELGEEASLLFFFLVQSLKPTFEAHAASWQRDHKEVSFPQGFCPFCGGLAGMGEIRDEGKRVLHCPLCATSWEYLRLQCPYCQNKDQEELTYFQVEGEAGYRVDICLRCRHYLKTVDTRETGEPLEGEVEDYLTLHLDHLAQEEGYRRPENLFAEVR